MLGEAWVEFVSLQLVEAQGSLREKAEHADERREDHRVDQQRRTLTQAQCDAATYDVERVAQLRTDGP